MEVTLTSLMIAPPLPPGKPNKFGGSVMVAARGGPEISK